MPRCCREWGMDASTQLDAGMSGCLWAQQSFSRPAPALPVQAHDPPFAPPASFRARAAGAGWRCAARRAGLAGQLLAAPADPDPDAGPCRPGRRARRGSDPSACRHPRAADHAGPGADRRGDIQPRAAAPRRPPATGRPASCCNHRLANPARRSTRADSRTPALACRDAWPDACPLGRAACTGHCRPGIAAAIAPSGPARANDR